MNDRTLLALYLEAIMDHDTDYEMRNELIYGALSIAARLGVPAGVRIDPEEPTWPVVYIELPGHGQCSWHVPEHPIVWDGHTTDEKYRRIRAFVAEVKGYDIHPHQSP